jgi:hypothetical protein
MELGRPSNTGSLVSAVLVGLLALASNHYARISPKVIKMMQERARQRALLEQQEAARKIRDAKHPALEHKFGPIPVIPDELEWSNEQLATTIESCEDSIATAFQAWQLERSVVDRPQVVSTLSAVTRIQEYLSRYPQAIDTLSSTSRLALLRVYFMSAQIAPKTHADAFRHWDDRLTHSSVVAEQSQAAALRFYLQQDLRRPKLAELNKGLSDFAKQYPNHALGASLCSMISRELWSRGHQKAAEGVLRHGIEIHAGNPSVSQLVNQLVDQQSLPSSNGR